MKEITYVDMDDTLCMFTKAWNFHRWRWPDTAWPQSIPNFFLDLKPHDGAVDAWHTLSANPDLNVYILGAPSSLNPLSYTEKRLWVEKWLGIEAAHKLILCPDKSLLKGTWLIDDLIEGKGQENFEGHVLQFGSEKYPDWAAILEFFA